MIARDYYFDMQLASLEVRINIIAAHYSIQDATTVNGLGLAPKTTLFFGSHGYG